MACPWSMVEECKSLSYRSSIAHAITTCEHLKKQLGHSRISDSSYGRYPPYDCTIAPSVEDRDPTQKCVNAVERPPF